MRVCFPSTPRFSLGCAQSASASASTSTTFTLRQVYSCRTWSARSANRHFDAHMQSRSADTGVLASGTASPIVTARARLAAAGAAALAVGTAVSSVATVCNSGRTQTPSFTRFKSLVDGLDLMDYLLHRAIVDDY